MQFSQIFPLLPCACTKAFLIKRQQRIPLKCRHSSRRWVDFHNVGGEKSSKRRFCFLINSIAGGVFVITRPATCFSEFKGRNVLMLKAKIFISMILSQNALNSNRVFISCTCRRDFQEGRDLLALVGKDSLVVGKELGKEVGKDKGSSRSRRSSCGTSCSPTWVQTISACRLLEKAAPAPCGGRTADRCRSLTDCSSSWHCRDG